MDEGAQNFEKTEQWMLFVLANFRE